MSKKTWGPGCPSCHVGVLALNDDDFWECTECGLQARTWVPGRLAVLDWRGSGKFRTPRRVLPPEERIVIPETDSRFLKPLL